jgi:biopolymer transport protein ExbD
MPLKTHFDETPPLNLTAMLDVMFLLIIFFMLGTRFVDEERQIGLRVPAVADRNTPTAGPERKTINVHCDGTITLDQSAVTLEELTRQLALARGRNSSLGVLVRGDARGQWEQVAAVLSACKRAGVADLGVSVRPPPVQK